MASNYEQFVQKKVNDFDFSDEDINKNFDIFFCFLINKILSYLYGKNKIFMIKTMKYIYEKLLIKYYF